MPEEDLPGTGTSGTFRMGPVGDRLRDYGWIIVLLIVLVCAVLVTLGVGYRIWAIAEVSTIFGGAVVLIGGVLIVAEFTTRKGQARQSDAAYEEGKVWLLRLILAVGLGMVAIVIYSAQYTYWPRAHVASTASAGLLAAGAGWFAGALLGFLFGIPFERRDRQTPAQQGAERGARERATSFGRLQRSTALAQISDWLTKIIVGVGLAQLTKFPGELNALAAYIANGMAASPEAPAGLPGVKLLALGICIYFPIAGFLFGYIWGNVYFFRVLSESEDHA